MIGHGNATRQCARPSVFICPKPVGLSSLFNQILVVDAGSSHGVIAVAAGARIHREPMLVALQERPQRKRRRGPPPPPRYRLHSVGSGVDALAEESGLRLTHPVERGTISDPEGLSLVLQRLMQHAPAGALRRLVLGVRAVLLVPLHLPDAERLKYQEVLRDFGFNRIRLVEAPRAAACAVGLLNGAQPVGMLIDLGGGQTTAVAFSLDSVAGWGWRPLGGRDLDRAVADYVLRRYRLRLPAARAEALKLAIGSLHPLPRPRQEDIAGIDTVTGVEKKVTLDDNELRDVLIDACEPLILAIQEAFVAVDPELAADIAQTEIVLVGGGALLAGLADFLTERTELRFRVADDPLDVAVRGAFRLAELSTQT